MKSISLLIAGIMCLTSCYTNKKSLCEKFKIGEFILQLDVPPYDYTIIDRNDSVQIEVNLETNDTVINSIKWTGPCEYELKFLKSNRERKDQVAQFLDPKPLKTEILKADKNYYTFKMYREGINFWWVDTLRVLSR